MLRQVGRAEASQDCLDRWSRTEWVPSVAKAFEAQAPPGSPLFCWSLPPPPICFRTSRNSPVSRREAAEKICARDKRARGWSRSLVCASWHQRAIEHRIAPTGQCQKFLPAKTRVRPHRGEALAADDPVAARTIDQHRARLADGDTERTVRLFLARPSALDGTKGARSLPRDR
jgi:hypothetical protein